MVLSVARLAREKGLDTLVRAVAAAANARLLLVVAGDGPERGALVSLADALGVRLVLNKSMRERLLTDAKGDCIDAALCLLQAAWAAARSASVGTGYGLPAEIDPLEGWIVTA